MIQDLLAQRAELDKKIAEAKTQALVTATADAIACFTRAGLTRDEALDEMTKRFKSGARKPGARKPGAKGVPKYFQNGGSGSWTGHGRKPLWFIAGDYRVA